MPCRSIRWAIVTSCTRPLAEVRIRAGGLPQPKYLVTSNDITRGKPDPEPYLKGAATLGVAAADCVVVEDAPAGIRSGKAAGASVLALQTTDVRFRALRRRRPLDHQGSELFAPASVQQQSSGSAFDPIHVTRRQCSAAAGKL